MKLKALALFFSIIALYLFQDLYKTYYSWFNVHSFTPVKVAFKYKNEHGEFQSFQQQGEKGFVSFKISDKYISGFWLKIIGDAKIDAIQFSGKEEKFFPLKGDFSDLEEPLEGKTKIRFFELAMYGFISFSFFSFFLNLFFGQKISDPEKTHEFKNIEFLRFVFCMTIVYHHIGDTLAYWSSAWLSVEFFFILSGFFLLLKFPSVDAPGFIKMKLIRYWPLMIFSALLCSVNKEEVYLNRILSEVFFLSGTGFYWEHGYNPPSWYMCTLFWILLFYFYLIKTQKRENANLIIGLISFFSFTALSRAGFGWIWHTLDGIGSKIPLALVRACGGVGTGYFLALMYQGQKSASSRSGRVVKLFFTMLEIIIFYYLYLSLFFKRYYLENNIYSVISFSALIYLFVCKRGYISQFLDKNVFAYMGRYTFSVFMTHSFITHNILMFLKEKYPHIVMDHLPYTISLVMLASLLAGIFFHYTIELPGKRILSRCLN